MVQLTDTCKRCGHMWTRRTDQDPVSCPKCKSPYWNKDKKVKK